MNNLFFLDVDTQRDFMLKDGALYVPGAEKIIPRLRGLFDFAVTNGLPIISSVDIHTPDDPEFAQFPPHCVRKTAGARKLDDTLLARPLVFSDKPVDRNLQDCVYQNRQIIVEKNTFDVFSNPVMERLVRVLPPRAIVFGVATEYCVKHAVLGLRRLGVQTVLVSDAVRAIAPATEKAALDEMRAVGVNMLTMKELLQFNF